MSQLHQVLLSVCPAFPDALVFIVSQFEQWRNPRSSDRLPPSVPKIVKWSVLQLDRVKEPHGWQSVSESEGLAISGIPLSFLTAALYTCLCCPAAAHPVSTDTAALEKEGLRYPAVCPQPLSGSKALLAVLVSHECFLLWVFFFFWFHFKWKCFCLVLILSFSVQIWTSTMY